MKWNKQLENLKSQLFPLDIQKHGNLKSRTKLQEGKAAEQNSCWEAAKHTLLQITHLDQGRKSISCFIHSLPSASAHIKCHYLLQEE